MRGAQTSFCALSDFPETGNKTPQREGVAKINVLDIFFAKMAFHKSLRKGYFSRLFLRLLR